MSNALVAAETWLYATLSNDATLQGIVGAGNFHGHVVNDPEATYPLVLYTLPGTGTNLLTFNAHRIWTEFVYAVRVVGRVETFAALGAGAAAIESLLSRASGSNASGVVAACIYEAPFVMVEKDRDGAELRHLGGLYRLQVQ